jgi:hypothetical protein
VQGKFEWITRAKLHLLLCQAGFKFGVKGLPEHSAKRFKIAFCECDEAVFDGKKDDVGVDIVGNVDDGRFYNTITKEDREITCFVYENTTKSDKPLRRFLSEWYSDNKKCLQSVTPFITMLEQLPELAVDVAGAIRASNKYYCTNCERRPYLTVYPCVCGH